MILENKKHRAAELTEGNLSLRWSLLCVLRASVFQRLCSNQLVGEGNHEGL